MIVCGHERVDCWRKMLGCWKIRRIMGRDHGLWSFDWTTTAAHDDMRRYETGTTIPRKDKPRWRERCWKQDMLGTSHAQSKPRMLRPSYTSSNDSLYILQTPRCYRCPTHRLASFRDEPTYRPAEEFAHLDAVRTPDVFVVYQSYRNKMSG